MTIRRSFYARLLWAGAGTLLSGSMIGCCSDGKCVRKDVAASPGAPLTQLTAPSALAPANASVPTATSASSNSVAKDSASGSLAIDPAAASVAKDPAAASVAKDPASSSILSPRAAVGAEGGILSRGGLPGSSARRWEGTPTNLAASRELPSAMAMPSPRGMAAPTLAIPANRGGNPASFADASMPSREPGASISRSAEFAAPASAGRSKGEMLPGFAAAPREVASMPPAQQAHLATNQRGIPMPPAPPPVMLSSLDDPLPMPASAATLGEVPLSLPNTALPGTASPMTTSPMTTESTAAPMLVLPKISESSSAATSAANAEVPGGFVMPSLDAIPTSPNR